MNRFSLLAGLAFALAVAVTAGLLSVVTGRGDVAHRHAGILSTFDRLAEAETGLDRDLLEIVAGMLPDYDPLVEHARAIEALLGTLSADPAAFAADLAGTYRARIEAKLDSAERIKGTAAFVRNEVNYLPFQIARYGEKGRPDILRRLQAALIAELANTRQEEWELVPDGAEGDLLGHVATHLNALRTQKRELRQAIDAYFAVDARAVLERLRGAYLARYETQQWWWQAITTVLTGSTILLFIALGWSIARLGLAHIQTERAQARLRESEATFSAIFQASPEPVAIVERPTGAILDVNDAFERALGYGKAEVLGRPLPALLGAEGSGGPLRTALDGAERLTNREVRLARKGGEAFTALASLDGVRIGARDCHVFVARDISDRIAAEQSARMAASVFDNAREGILITDAHGTILRVNPAFSRITGYTPEEAVGQTPRLLNSRRHDRGFYRDLWASLVETGYWTGEIWNRRKSGEVYPEWLSISAVRDETGAVSRYVAVFTDITTIKHQEEALQHLAHHDALTGLPNRVLLADRMEQAISQARRNGKAMAVGYLDLDGFKPINDRFGHLAGDSLLIEVAKRIDGVLRGGDTVARLGGDEFAILLQNLNGVEDCGIALQRILDAVAEPIRLPGQEAAVAVSASIGVSLYPEDDENPDTLLRHADLAMYGAKQAGRNRFHLYDAAQDHRAEAHRETVDGLRRAIATGEFTLYYQPKVNMRLGKVVGAEALIRWNHPERGLQLPGQFLPLIEETELEVAVGEWVLDAALAQMAAWREAGIDLTVSVNIAARHLLRNGFTQRLTELLAAHASVPPDRLQLEVLETAALEDINRARSVLQSCRELGVSIALDDFGTGYSSLTYLRHLPVQTLKIDQSFVRNLPHDSEDLAIVESVVVLANALNRNVLAEGVESVEQGRRLLQMGCELAQGYCIARPMPAGDLPGWMRTWRADASWLAHGAGTPRAAAADARVPEPVAALTS
ncbi:MAG TPA: EAL domain-containing protein [Azospirillum sp.]|nr:EAL domain-containing protein [Azospirillum sp.]